MIKNRFSLKVVTAFGLFGCLTIDWYLMAGYTGNWTAEYIDYLIALVGGTDFEMAGWIGNVLADNMVGYTGD